MNSEEHQSTTTQAPWTHRLAHILRPSFHLPQHLHPTIKNAVISRSSRHPQGSIWKHIFSVSVYSDLDELNTTTGASWRTNTSFVRLEHFGLSGLILYELPVLRGSDGGTLSKFSLDDVFGSEKEGFHDGMSIYDLLAHAETELIYFPAYACTSFMTGQVMHAFLTDTRHLRPYPLRNGFRVYHDPPEATFTHDIENEEWTSDQSREQLQVYNAQSSDSDSEVEHVVIHCNSSLDSVTPQTPPPLDPSPLHEKALQK